MKKPRIKSCPICNTEFDHGGTPRKYCTDKCAKQATKKVHGDHRRDYYRKKLYGLTQPQLDALYDRARDRCQICDKHQSEFKKGLCIDHCHKTGQVRGLLCGPCNRAIGIFNDDISRLSAAINYLSANSMPKQP